MWINVIQAKLESRNCWSLVLLAANTPRLRCCMGFMDQIFGILAVCKCAVASSFATVSNVPFAPSPSTLSAAYSKYRVCTPLTDFSGVMVPGGCRSQSCHGSMHTTIPQPHSPSSLIDNEFNPTITNNFNKIIKIRNKSLTNNNY